MRYSENFEMQVKENYTSSTSFLDNQLTDANTALSLSL